MSVYFQSLCSSSRGNCALIWTDKALIAIDCGFQSQRECKQLLGEYTGRIEDLSAVVISHRHTDHINQSSLKVLSSYRIPIRAHHSVVEEICDYHGCEDWDKQPVFKPFHNRSFQAGDLRITPMEVPHDPDVSTFGFVIRHGSGKRLRKIVVCTDFCNYKDVLPHFVDADFVFVESNHDPELLQKHFNYKSRFHMSNPKTAWLLYHAIKGSKRPPQAVMLGHLSDERNRDKLALGMVKEVFERQQMPMGFRLYAAPRYEPSRTIRIN